MIDFKSEVVTKLRERYNGIHPLIFHRSCERAKSYGDLFDILEQFSEERDGIYPAVWHEGRHRWVKTDDMFQSDNFIIRQKEAKNDSE